MKVAFRVDASLQTGSGHLMRCLTLAGALRERGAQSRFVTSKFLSELVLSSGFAVDAELGGADWLVVDHYGLDAAWERQAHRHAPRLAALDDLARPHECDLLLDQNHFPDAEARYAGKLPARCRRLLGARYALLRPEFAEFRRRGRERSGRVRTVLVSLGGTDAANHTAAAIGLLKGRGLEADVVVGAANPHAAALERECAAAGFRFHRQPGNMAELMARADLAIGAGGTTTWERCCLGLPTVQIAVAENQREPSRALAQAGLVSYAGESLTAQTLDAALKDPETLKRQSTLTSALVDGQGAKRVAAALFASSRTVLALREANDDDAQLYFDWANDPEVRRQSFDSRPIAYPGHAAWFAQRLADSLLLVAVDEAGVPAGQVRFEADGSHWKVNFSLAAEFRGAGLGVKMLAMSIQELRQRNPGARLRAEVKAGNAASRRVFAALGFAPVSATGFELDR